MFGHTKQLKDEIINIGRKLHDLRLVAGTSGNLSARIDKNNILITATGTALGDLRYDDIIKVDLTNEEVVKLMKESGCSQLDFGIESGNQRVLDEIINKKATTDHARQAFALCKKVGIRAMANLMLGNPTETEEEMKLTLALAKEIKPDYVFYSIVAPLPNTKLYEMVNAMLPEDNKITVEDYKSIDWTGKNYSEKLNFSKVKDLSRIHKIFERELHGLVLRNAVKNNIFYFKMMLMLPHRIEKLRYLGKKLCNFFVVKRIFGKDLRL